MDDMDDETFNMYIATDDGIDSGKENENSNLPRQPKTTQRQFDMISDFMKCNNEELLDKDVFGRLWDNLAAQLNDIGPPDHTVVEWKKIWSAHKSYKNRKRSSATSSFGSNIPRKTARIDQSSQESVAATIDVHVADEDERATTQSDLLTKLDNIIANQIAMLSKLDDLVQSIKDLLFAFSKEA